MTNVSPIVKEIGEGLRALRDPETGLPCVGGWRTNEGQIFHIFGSRPLREGEAEEFKRRWESQQSENK